jgi:hypothetical protein
VRRLGIALVLIGTVLVAAWAFGASGFTYRVVCDAYDRPALMSSIAPGQTPLWITPPPGATEVGPGCWRVP